MTEYTLAVSPSGLPRLVPAAPDDDPIARDRRAALVEAFEIGPGAGVLHLGAVEVGTDWPPAFSYYREIGHELVARVCAHPDLETLRHRIVVEPPLDDLERLANAAPPMKGAEYVTAESLATVWREVNQALAEDGRGEKVRPSRLFLVWEGPELGRSAPSFDDWPLRGDRAHGPRANEGGRGPGAVGQPAVGLKLDGVCGRRRISGPQVSPHPTPGAPSRGRSLSSSAWNRSRSRSRAVSPDASRARHGRTSGRPSEQTVAGPSPASRRRQDGVFGVPPTFMASLTAGSSWTPSRGGARSTPMAKLVTAEPTRRPTSWCPAAPRQRIRARSRSAPLVGDDTLGISLIRGGRGTVRDSLRSE